MKEAMKEVWIVFDRSGEILGVYSTEEKAEGALEFGDFWERHEVK